MMGFELTKDYLKFVNELIEEQNKNELIKIAQQNHAADIADILDKLEVQNATYFFNIIDDSHRADVLMELEDGLRESLLNDLSSKEIAEEVIENLGQI